ncbi:MAG: tetratricopeptide repeat protein [Planctomycetota bacterium]
MRALRAGLEVAERAGLIDEREVNALGYDLLGQGCVTLVTAAFRLNVATPLASANAHDSLGEALKAAGDVPGAIEVYERALALEPDGPNAQPARATLAELKALEDHPPSAHLERQPGPWSGRPGRASVIWPPSTTSAPLTATYGTPVE